MIAPARSAAYEALRAVHLGRVDAPAALARTRDALHDSRDRSLAAELVLGTLRWRATLDHLIQAAGERPVDRFDPEVLDILRLGAYQLLHLERVPASAVVNDAVDMAKRAKRRSATGAVNAVLRRISRTRGRLALPREDSPIDFLSVTCSHPRWLAARWLDRYGFAVAREWTAFNNQAAPLTLRANTLRTSRDGLAEMLGRESILVEPTRYAPDGLIVKNGHALVMAHAADGRFVVQDEASQLVGAFASARAGERVLDACAAPGGKTTVMAADMADRGMLAAADLRARRIALLRDTVAQSGAACVRIVRADAGRPLPFARAFDRVLLDAPCSGLGTLRRDPDVKWRRQEGDLAAFAVAQARMLDQAADVVRPGGRIIYSTCSSEPDENDLVIDAFLGRHVEFAAIDPRDGEVRLADGVAACLDPHGRLRTTPHEHGLEAFFAVMLLHRGDGLIGRT